MSQPRPMRRLPVADPVAPVLLALAAILAGAKLGGDLAERIGQPAVLGELVVGILLGNLDLVGVPWFRSVAADHTIDVLAGLGVVLLLFEVGRSEERRVGKECRSRWSPYH